MSPGTHVRINENWARVYRKPGARLSGPVVAVSPTGAVLRVEMDDLGDTYVRAEHVLPIWDPVERIAVDPALSTETPLTAA